MRGYNGRDGTNGLPGIVAYEVKSNISTGNKYLVPPSIAGEWFALQIGVQFARTNLTNVPAATPSNKEERRIKMQIP